ncbi:unnamed protein product [Calypogeia fissa]
MGFKTKHAMVVPVCLQGHFLGIYRFAVDLAKRGVTITFVGLAREIALLKTFEELGGLDFNLVSYEDYGSETFVSIGEPMLDILDFVPKSKAHFQPILDKLMADKKAGLAGPTCLISDRYLSIWAVDAAKELGISYYQFWSCGVTFVRTLQAQVPLYDDGTLTIKTGPGGSPYLEPFEGSVHFPGLPPLEYREMVKPPPEDFKHIGAATDVMIGRNVDRADALIVNSFYELEAPQVDALRRSWKESFLPKIPKLYLVGPLSKVATFKDRSLANLKSSGADSLQWLDGRAPLSVVYVCVGTIARLSPGQVEELARALEASEQSFLWVVARGAAEAIPPGFAERTKDRGLMVGWVPQLQILQHPAIGGFVTHCGWNSIIESITAGVPMACWPQLTNDQPLNCRHLVDVLKIAVEVRNDDTLTIGATWEGTPLSRRNYLDLEKAVRLLLSHEGKALRARVQELKKEAAAAVGDGGVSKQALDDVVESIPY